MIYRKNFVAIIFWLIITYLRGITALDVMPDIPSRNAFMKHTLMSSRSRRRVVHYFKNNITVGHMTLYICMYIYYTSYMGLMLVIAICNRRFNSVICLWHDVKVTFNEQISVWDSCWQGRLLRFNQIHTNQCRAFHICSTYVKYKPSNVSTKYYTYIIMHGGPSIAHIYLSGTFSLSEINTYIRQIPSQAML